MPFKEETAKRIMSHIVKSGNGLISLLPELEQELTEQEFKVIKREIGRIIGTMDSALSAKVAHQYPELAPEAVPIAHAIENQNV